MYQDGKKRRVKCVSYLGDSVSASEEARAKDAARFLRLCTSLGLARKRTRMKMYEFIKIGALSVAEAEQVIHDRLSPAKKSKYSIMRMLLNLGMADMQQFGFRVIELCETEKVESITLFP